ncbi:MAG: hypothetical protein CML68_02310 [Rhodobacteraceae bacterium]|nr:hypothetical protein [Paracoccaceae bacterium]
MRILIVDDSPDDREVLRRAVAKMPARVDQVDEAATEDEALDWLDPDARDDVILLDYSLPGSDGLDTLRAILMLAPQAAVVMITGQGNEEIAVQAMRCGAQDYLTKSVINPESLNRSVTNALERSAMQRKIDEQQKNLENFARILVHDLRGPLNTMRRSIEMLSEDMPEQVSDDVIEIMGFIDDGARRMDALILSLRAYTRIDATAPTMGPVDLNMVLQNVRDALGAEIDVAGAEIVCECELPWVLGDPPQLEQLVQNLVSNAIKYNRAERPRIHVSAEPVEGGWQIQVSDNGIGVDPARVRDIFEPFRRLHSAREYSGTGLGLATCRRIAERHGGRIWCDSQPGIGSTFVLHLLAAQDTEERISEAG